MPPDIRATGVAAGGRKICMADHAGDDSFRWAVRVRFGDTDPYGVVYFVSYFRYMKEALDEFLRSCGLSPEHTYKDVEGGRGLPVAASSARFIAPARYGDVLEIEVTVAACTEKSVTFAFRIGRETGRGPVATGEITCVAIDGGWRPVALPKQWRERLLSEADPPCNRP